MIGRMQQEAPIKANMPVNVPPVAKRPPLLGFLFSMIGTITAIVTIGSREK
jgi:hypothetical protein